MGESTKGAQKKPNGSIAALYNPYLLGSRKSRDLSVSSLTLSPTGRLMKMNKDFFNEKPGANDF